MISGIYTATAGASIQSAKNDIIANNLANLATTGFKRQLAIFRERAPENIERGGSPSPLDSRLGGLGGGVALSKAPTDFTEGAIVHTGNSLDFAINGKGFFKVQDAEGKVFYTRAGGFALDTDYNVITASGKHMLLDNEDNVVNLRDFGDIKNYHAAGRRIGLADFSRKDALKHVGEGLFQDKGDAGMIKDINIGGYKIGYLEKSNVNPVVELSAMIEGFRAYEANMKVIRSHDAALSRAVNDVGRVR